MKKLIQTTLCLAAGSLLCATGVYAAQLTWDPLGNQGTTPAGGNWDTTAGNNVWYNGTSDVAWSQTSTTAGTMGATFGGADGNWAINLDGTQIATTNITINNSGYAFSGSAIYLATSQFLTVAPGKSVTFNCNISGANNGAQYWPIGANSSLTLTGNIGPGTTQVRLAGPSTSAFYLSGNNNVPSITYILAPVYFTNGSWTSSSSFFIGYAQTLPAPNSTQYTTGTFSVGTATSSATLTVNGNNVLFIGRSSGSGTLNLTNGTVNVGQTALHNLAICYDTSTGVIGTMNIYGGNVNVGSPSVAGTQIALFDTTSGTPTGAVATYNQVAGTVYSYGGMSIAPAGGNLGGATANINISGGTLNLGATSGKGIYLGSVSTAPTVNINLTGATISDVASWSSSLPMTLGTANGNINFNPPDTITLSGPLTGAGGLNMIGGGTLALSGANNYSGLTTVSNGTLSVATGALPASGAVTVDASVGSPTLSVAVSPGNAWTVNGPLTFQNGGATFAYQFSGLPPSPSVAPLQVNGDVDFTSTPSMTIGGSEIAKGTYPLITYTGAVNGTLPTVTSWTGGSASAGTIVNNPGTKTISLVVNSSAISVPLYWHGGTGAWDTSTPDWLQSGAPADYSDGDAVIFDDSGGTSPMTVSLNMTANPASVTFNNATKSYTVSGSGSISGGATVSLTGAGSVTLSGANNYIGGTTVSAGLLNINNAGNGGASAIGVGALTLNPGATIDNTSGSDEVLQASISQNWNGDFSYGGAGNNLDLGNGSVTLNASIVITVTNRTLQIDGSISDNGNEYSLTKNGNGTLTLTTGNSFGGGMTVNAGLLNLGNAYSAGQGQLSVLTMNGGSLDNISGSQFTLANVSHVWGGNFTVLNSSPIDFGNGQINVPNGPGSVTVNVVTNTIYTEGNISSGNTLVGKSGPGKWVIGGAATTAESLQLSVSGGEVDFAKVSGQAIGVGHAGLTIQSGALVQDEHDYQIHSDTQTTPVPVNLSGGVFDMNGYNENVDQPSISNGGTLRNSASILGGSTNSVSTLWLISGYDFMLSGTNCQFDVTASDGVLNVKGPLAGSGTLVKLGLGVLNLLSNNIYTGDTLISNGTLGLVGAGALPDTAGINLTTNGAILDLSSNNIPDLTLAGGQYLSGFGTVNGSVTASPGSTVSPGSASTIGVLTVTNSVALAGTTAMKLNAGTLASDELSAGGTISYGGTLVLTTISGALANGNTFTLFHAGGGYNGSFSSISPATPGPGLAWNTGNLALNGTLSVMTSSAPPPPVVTSVSLSGHTLSLMATNGPASTQFVILQSANIGAPLNTWTPIYTNSFDAGGDCNVSFTVGAGPQEFFVISTH